MYKCGRCGAYFSEPIIGEMEQDTGYTPSMCPECGEPDDYEEADNCVVCGEPIEMGEELCDDCKEDVKSLMKKVASELGLDQDGMYNALTWYIEEEL